MNEAGYLRLEQSVRELAGTIGAPGLGDETIRERERGEDGERRPLPGRKRLLLRLEALERHLLLRHRGVYDQAMSLIEKALARRVAYADRVVVPEGAVLVANLPGEAEPVRIALSETPDLSEVLQRVRRLMGQIHEDFDGEA